MGEIVLYLSGLGLRRFAPFSLPPRAITKKSKAALLAQIPFFARHRSLQEQALDGPPPHKKSATIWLRF